MHTYFISFSFLLTDGERRYGETVKEFTSTVGRTKESLQVVKAALLRELLQEYAFNQLVSIHIITLEHQCSRPYGGGSQE